MINVSANSQNGEKPISQFVLLSSEGQTDISIGAKFILGTSRVMTTLTFFPSLLSFQDYHINWCESWTPLLNQHCPVIGRPHEFSFKSIIQNNIQFNLTQKCSNMCRLPEKPYRSHTCIVILSCKERLITTILFYSRLNCLRDAYRYFTIKFTPVLSSAEGAPWKKLSSQRL